MQPQFTFTQDSTQLIEPGYCHCGCGGKTKIAKMNDARDGTIKGEPRRFISGHNGRKYPTPEPPNPSGLCLCGCGQPAPISPTTCASKGYVKGQPLRFVQGHYGRVQPSQAPWVEMFGLLQPYGKCQCGCGQDAPIAKTIRKHQGIKQGQPTRFIFGHGGRVQEPPPRLPIERFWDYVVRGDSPDDCWGWSGSVEKDGYALLSVRGLGNRAYRMSFILHYGPIPKGMCVCHHCDNPACTNPRHLFLGTTQDNTADMVAKRRHLFGELHNKAKLADADIPRIRELRASGLTQQAISDQYGVSQSAISSILLGKTWAHVP